MNEYDKLMMWVTEEAIALREQSILRRQLAAAYFMGCAAMLQALDLMDEPLEQVERKLSMLLDIPLPVQLDG